MEFIRCRRLLTQMSNVDCRMFIYKYMENIERNIKIGNKKCHSLGLNLLTLSSFQQRNNNFCI
ncbi:hypothetical protein IEQ34_022810 [Dendrobium chrysotoxum]|uniref:Ubiquitin-like protease family profile domain-containing protein n=1 Tax=Dendrobium chrysotoxum TaxID=161865 RepID=A0AAV7FK93_DENCH|nr:hypothetical protein IEQ34_022810 [Dendrobium chrysotoxum]